MSLSFVAAAVLLGKDWTWRRVAVKILLFAESLDANVEPHLRQELELHEALVVDVFDQACRNLVRPSFSLEAFCAFLVIAACNSVNGVCLLEIAVDEMQNLD